MGLGSDHPFLGSFVVDEVRTESPTFSSRGGAVDGEPVAATGERLDDPLQQLSVSMKYNDKNSKYMVNPGILRHCNDPLWEKAAIFYECAGDVELTFTLTANDISVRREIGHDSMGSPIYDACFYVFILH